MGEGIIPPTSYKSDKGIGLGLGLELSDLWDVRLISVETGIIIVPNRFEQGSTVDKAGYKI